MRRTALCDCTLQNGGNVCNWKFGSEMLKEYIEKMSQSGVEYIELGMLRLEGYRVDRAVYPSTDELLTCINPEHTGTCYSATVTMEKSLPIDRFDNCKVTNLLVRVQFDKSEYLDAFEYCQKLQSKGYGISVHPLHADMYSPEEYLRLIEKFATLSSMNVFYIDDSFGMLSGTDKVYAYASLANKFLPAQVSVGFCGYNADGKIYETVHHLIGLNFNRTWVMDASIAGIGLGAGMLPIEQISSEQEDSYHSVFFGDVYTRYLQEMRKSYSWGPSPSYLLAQKRKINPKYIDFLEKKHDCTIEAIAKVIEFLPASSYVTYDKIEIKNSFKKYANVKYGLAIILPTCARPTAIDYYLFNCAWEAHRLGIDIIVYDSSTDDRTEAFVRNFQIDGCDNVIYHRYEGEFDGFSLDHKVIDAYTDYCDKYRYLWVCRDGLVIKPKEAIDTISDCMENGTDLILCNATFRDFENIGNKIYDSSKELFVEQCVHLITLGVVLVKTSFLKSILQTVETDLERYYSLWQPMAFFDYITREEFTAEYRVGDIFSYNMAAPKQSFWKSKAIQQWSELWYRTVMNLPSHYDDVKEQVLKIKMFDFSPFAVSELIKVKASGGLTLKSIQKNKKIIPYVTDTPLSRFYMVLLLPKPIAKFLAKHPDAHITKFAKVLYRIFAGLVPEDDDLL